MKLMQWETKASNLPYYLFEEVPPHVKELDRGVYLVRHVKGDLSSLGFVALPSVIVLKRRVNFPPTSNSPTDVLNVLDRSSSEHEESHKIRLMGYAYALKESIDFFPNRLYWTLPRSTADVLMTWWLQACYTGRCVRTGMVFGQDWDDQGNPAGVLGVCKVDATTEAIDLVGVSRFYQGRGMGKALVNWALNSSVANNMIVRTEACNLPALAMYRACGFKEIEADPQWFVRIE